MQYGERNSVQKTLNVQSRPKCGSNCRIASRMLKYATSIKGDFQVSRLSTNEGLMIGSDTIWTTVPKHKDDSDRSQLCFLSLPWMAHDRNMLQPMYDKTVNMSPITRDCRSLEDVTSAELCATRKHGASHVWELIGKNALKVHQLSAGQETFNLGLN